MKKTFPANINGSIFYIDEDAYSLLNNYLDQLRKAFPGEEGTEIINDIEARIAEHFTENQAVGSQVITIYDVNRVIEMMGRPDELADSPAEVDTEAETTAEDVTSPAAASPTPPPYTPVKKKLFRNMQNKVFGGVLSGVACYFGWNANILRLLVVLLALFTYLGPLIIAYLIAWMVIPAAVTSRQILEMRGEPVTVGNVGETVITPEQGSSNAGATIMRVIGNMILLFFGFITSILLLVSIGIFITMVVGLILYTCMGDTSIIESFDMDSALNPVLDLVGGICLALSVALPTFAATWGIIAAVFHTKGISKTALICGAVFELLLIIASCVLISLA